jgi:hypothetical protein
MRLPIGDRSAAAAAAAAPRIQRRRLLTLHRCGALAGNLTSDRDGEFQRQASLLPTPSIATGRPKLGSHIRRELDCSSTSVYHGCTKIAKTYSPLRSSTSFFFKSKIISANRVCVTCNWVRSEFADHRLTFRCPASDGFLLVYNLAIQILRLHQSEVTQRPLPDCGRTTTRSVVNQLACRMTACHVMQCDARQQLPP